MFNLNDIATVFGLILGSSGFSLSLLNYMRDKPKIKITLQWEMTTTDTGENCGVVSVANVGRRPIYVSHVALKLPQDNDESYLLLKEGLRGTRIAEGDAPLVFIVTYENMEKYKKSWFKIRAQISDSTGRTWLSNKTSREQVPQWAK